MGMIRYENKKRRSSVWNYSASGTYFITFCTAGRLPILGSISHTEDALGVHAAFVPSSLGVSCAEAIKRANPSDGAFAIEQSVIMPNHVHLLISIGGDGKALTEERKNQLVPKVVSSIKSQVTREARRARPGAVVWQKSFYDRVVRDEKELKAVRKYIEENPLKWAVDRYYTG